MDSRTHFSRNGQGCPGLAGCQLLHGMRITISAGSHGKACRCLLSFLLTTPTWAWVADCGRDRRDGQAKRASTLD